MRVPFASSNPFEKAEPPASPGRTEVRIKKRQDDYPCRANTRKGGASASVERACYDACKSRNDKARRSRNHSEKASR